jgi:hypothetical protein
MMRDDKLVSVAIRIKQPIERVTWVWGAILESAAEIDDDGIFRVDPAEVAYFLRADEADIRAVLAGLTDAGRVAEGRVVKWSDRQFKSDRSAERQARYRDKQREVPQLDAQQTSRDGQVTSPSQRSDAPETETELDTEPEKKVAPKGALANTPEFDAFWSVYPEKVGKGAARKAFPLALSKAPLETLVDGVRRYIATKPADRNYCHPSTWLNEERWADEPASPPARGSPQQQAMTTSEILQAIGNRPHENQPRPPEDRSGLRQAISYLRPVGAG